MTIGILRRISDYGITIHRGYVLLLNIWFYGIYIYIFIRKAESIKWIPISFAAIALFFSIGFWSIPNVTKHILIAELSSEKDEKKIRDKMGYLCNRYGKENVPQFVSDNVWCETYKYSSESKDTEKRFSYYAEHDKNEILNTKGFNTFVNIDCHYSSTDNKKIDCYVEGKQLIIKIIPDNRTFSFPLSEEILNDSYPKNVRNIFQYDDYIISLNGIRGGYYKTKDKIELRYFSGYLFYNK
jgi:hypothetical protein